MNLINGSLATVQLTPMNAKQRKQYFNRLVAEGRMQDACTYLWSTVFIIYCNNKARNGKEGYVGDWFRSLTNQRLEILANENNYRDSNEGMIRLAQQILDERLDKQLGISD